MKKKLLGIAIVAIVAVGAAWNLNVNKNDFTITGLALANVEALAMGESGSDCITGDCRWREYEFCDYTCNGTHYSSSHMYNK